MSDIGYSYMKQKKYNIALDFLNKAKKNSLDLEDIYSEKEIMYVLYETYKAMGNKDKALRVASGSIFRFVIRVVPAKIWEIFLSRLRGLKHRSLLKKI